MRVTIIRSNLLPPRPYERNSAYFKETCQARCGKTEHIFSISGQLHFVGGSLPIHRLISINSNGSTNSNNYLHLDFPDIEHFFAIVSRYFFFSLCTLTILIAALAFSLSVLRSSSNPSTQRKGQTAQNITLMSDRKDIVEQDSEMCVDHTEDVEDELKIAEEEKQGSSQMDPPSSRPPTTAFVQGVTAQQMPSAAPVLFVPPQMCAPPQVVCPGMQIMQTAMATIRQEINELRKEIKLHRGSVDYLVDHFEDCILTANAKPERSHVAAQVTFKEEPSTSASYTAPMQLQPVGAPQIPSTALAPPPATISIPQVQVPIVSNVSNISNNSNIPPSNCLFCNEHHWSNTCSRFPSLSSRRRRFLELNRCERCFGPATHLATACQQEAYAFSVNRLVGFWTCRAIIPLCVRFNTMNECENASRALTATYLQTDQRCLGSLVAVG
ncbi:hypothetical protein COOONC_07701 [Cooperia oncophora]